MIVKKKINFIVLFLILFLVFSFIIFCSSESTSNTSNNTGEDTSTAEGNNSNIIDENTEVFGYGLLERLPGLWNGPVISTTVAGSFDIWYLDFRPISKAQVASYSELDVHTMNFMSFFIVKHDGQYKLAFRNGGGYKGVARIAYEVIDTVEENGDEAYYRFSDFVVGTKRVYTEMFFKGDKLTVQAFTSKYNTVEPAELHMKWEAKLADLEATKEAIEHFNYPQKVVIKDFSSTFQGMAEGVYLSEEDDPYDESSQPYLGEITINISIDDELEVDSKKQLFILFTTRTLYEGIKYIPYNLNYTSRYIFLDADTKSYTFKGMHPGEYYLYSFYDANSDKQFLSGDYMSSDPDNHFKLSEKGTIEVDTVIDYIIP